MYTLSKHNFRKIHQSNILRDIIQILKHWIKSGKSCQRNLSWNFPTLFENVYGNLINFLLEFVSQNVKLIEYCVAMTLVLKIDFTFKDYMCTDECSL